MNTELRLHNHEEARVLLGPLDRTARLLRETFDVQLVHRGDVLRILGDGEGVGEVRALLERALRRLRRGHSVSHAEIERWIDGEGEAAPEEEESRNKGAREHRSLSGATPRSKGQKNFLEAMRSCDVVLVTGPAGTGKTYLAVAAAVSALRSGNFKRLVLARPAVEAGERLGFLPGDFQAKVNPYLRPLYDALGDLVDQSLLRRYFENDIIEVCPLAYMRGRTLNESFIILDEAQNTTISQMRMFLTRMGEASRVVVTGDLTQVDLPAGVPSGMVDAVGRLHGVKGLTVVELGNADIVRHPIVHKIVEAYERSQSRMPSPEDRRANPVKRKRRRRK
ncbi:MAG: PhoH family protein [Planctomycetota bacterium]